MLFLRRSSSAVAHLRYLHGKLHELPRLPAGAAAVAVHLQLVAAAVLLRLLALRRPADVPVRGEAAAHGPLARVRQEDHELVEAAVQAGEQQGGAVVCWTRSDRQLPSYRVSGAHSEFTPPNSHQKHLQKTAAVKVGVRVRTRDVSEASRERETTRFYLSHFTCVNHNR